MFRDLYKKANEDIKGDRAILDKAFLQAAQPDTPKSPVFKYSFVGTVVAAAIVLGAVFANPSVFTNVTDNIGKLEENATEKATEANIIENDTIVAVTMQPAQEVNTTTETQKEKTVKNYTVKQNTAVEDYDRTTAVETVPETEDPYGVAAMSIWGEADDVSAEEGTEVAGTFTLRRPGGNKTDATEDAEVTSESETEVDIELATEVSTDAEMPTEVMSESETEAVAVFSYMHDCEYYKAGEWGVKTNGFVNTGISPVENAHDAIERAKNECTVEYDTVHVSCDMVEKVWRVTFFMSDTPGGDESVYMTYDGVTVLIVYGE